MANELDKCDSIRKEKDSLITLKDTKIEGLTSKAAFKSEQLTICATDNKKLHRKIIFWQVVSGVALVVGLLL
jgi:hypothetical protein